MDGSLSASDVALMSGRGYGDGWGGDGYGGMFGLLVLLGIMNGGFGNWGNGRGDFATTQDVNNAQQFGQLLDGNRDIMTQANNNTNTIVQAVNQSEYETIASLKDAQLQLQDRVSDLRAGQQAIMNNAQQCCCETKLLVQGTGADINQNLMQNRYENALNTASINENTTAQVQKVLDALSANRMADMQNEINQLQLANQMANVVRFPNAYTYNGGVFPPFTGTCGCGV